MRKSIPVIVCAAFATAFSLSAVARGPGGGAGGGDTVSHGSATGPTTDKALQNSNGRFSTDRDKGLERAEERMNQHGLDHENATESHKKRSPRRDGK
jgi:hypothetical protein